MKKNKSTQNKLKQIKKKRTIYLLLFVVALIFFILYSLWIPSSQIFGKTIYKNEQPEITLTFDDGPGPDTENILNILKENNITATFFITCEHINNANESMLIKKMSDYGNVVALHGYNHKIFQDYNQLNACKQILENITGQKVVYFRPPYGFKSPNTMSAAKKLNLTIVTWSVFPKDYSAKSSEQIISRVKRNLESNSIICFHDGPANRENTVDALPKIINYIKQKNYKIKNLKKN